MARRGWPSRLGVVMAGVVATIVMVAGSTPTAGAGVGVVPGTGAAAAAAVDSHAVTLITGDRVFTTGVGAGTGRTAVLPAAGREHMGFVRHQSPDGLYVVPADALGLVESGVLDRQLFNITRLIENGYDDASRKELPLLIEGDPTIASASPLSAVGLEVAQHLPSLGLTVASQVKATAGPAWLAIIREAAGSEAPLASAIRRVWLDGMARIMLDESVPQIGAPAAWAAGLTAAGTTVAVLDSGYDPDHPDLADAVVDARNFTDAPDVRDTVGHGTHVASIVTGNGAASGGRFQGVAPDTQLLIGKVCNDFGCPFSSILAGMEWAATSGADVVNMSLGGPDGPELDPVEEAVNTLTAQYGTVFVVAAGNDGILGDESLSSPSSADAAVSVGAVSKQDELAEFSSRGPRIGDGAIKPDITAPGVDIAAARAAGTQLGEPVGDHYVRVSGTSMATPHVAGAAAILAGQHPDWTPDQLKATLMASADPHPALGPFAQGAGRLDVAGAVTQAVYASPASLGLGVARWPHDDDEPTVGSVTFHNTGTAPVTLALTLVVLGPDGTRAPAGMLTVDVPEVTVPAGGATDVGITADTAVHGPDGFYSGMLLARSADGSTTVGTPVAINREVESYDLTLTFLDRTSQPALSFFAFITGLDEPRFRFVGSPQNPATLRLPRGRYVIDSEIDTVDPTLPFGLSSTLVVEPELPLDRDTDVVVDARRGRPVSVTIPNDTARPAMVDIGHRSQAAWGATSFDFLAAGFDGVYVAPTRRLPDGAFVTWVNSTWAEPGTDGQFVDSPYVYNIVFVTEGRFPGSLAWRVRQRDLATVTNSLAAAAPGKYGDTPSWPFLPSLGESLGFAVLLPVPLPFERVEYFNGGRQRWHPNFVQFPDLVGFEDTFIDAAPVDYRVGRRSAELWNAAVFGPAFPNIGLPFPWVGRTGDRLDAFIPLFSDQAPTHAGFSAVATGSVTLVRDGVEIGRSASPQAGSFELPADVGTYRLTAEASRQGDADLSSTLNATWTFRSGHVAGEEPESLPLLAVRFAPRLDLENRAAAGSKLHIPVSVERQFGSSASRITDLTVDVSFDDGQTWQPVRLTERGRNWMAVVRHPAAAGFVSLRAAVGDRDGNRVDETIIRAYRLG
jgi:subtilisin family serine protease